MKSPSPVKARKRSKVPESEWQWFGFSAHFCCGEWCRFHMATRIGDLLVSTVGKYVHPRNSGASENSEREWLAGNPEGEDIGYDRKYETMMFRVDGECACGCGQPTIDGHELEARGANDSKLARENHMMVCRKAALSTLGLLASAKEKGKKGAAK